MTIKKFSPGRNMESIRKKSRTKGRNDRVMQPKMASTQELGTRGKYV